MFLYCIVDHDVITIRYPDMWTLMEHLHGMGETNATLARAPHVYVTLLILSGAFHINHSLDCIGHVMYS
jgi:hypothetical protein